jgi:fucose permease
MPTLFPNAAYLWLAVGTVIFSVSGGLVEVLISPIIAALPAENPDREMSKLHSIYAWGVVGMVVFSTVFLAVFRQESWWILSLILMLIPLSASLLFSRAYIPEMDSDEKTEKVSKLIRNPAMLLGVACIFFGGASECTMAQWCSGYIENVFEMNKVLGDVFGVAMFAAMLGFGRTLYSKIGKRIHKTLLMCAVGATVCYVTAALSNLPLVGLLACGLTGLCTSMLWPGNLIAIQERIPTGGVAMFALMAAGGDLGASVGPQMVGAVTDMAANSEFLLSIGNAMGIAPDQIGMKAGMLVGMLFPLIGIFCYAHIWRRQNKTK